MKKPAILLVLALAGLGLLGAALMLRRPAPVDVPPPVAPPLPPSGVPLLPPRPEVPPRTPPPGPPEDPLLARWKAGVRQKNAGEVTELQNVFLAREAEYRERLTAVAKDDADPRIRAFTVAVLGRMKDPPEEAFFIERASDAHEYPRTSAAQALEKRGTQACLAVLDRLASGDPAEAVRAAALRAAKAVRSR